MKSVASIPLVYVPHTSATILVRAVSFLVVSLIFGIVHVWDAATHYRTVQLLAHGPWMFDGHGKWPRSVKTLRGHNLHLITANFSVLYPYPITMPLIHVDEFPFDLPFGQFITPLCAFIALWPRGNQDKSASKSVPLWELS